MPTLTVQQERGADAAAEVSKKAFEAAMKLPEKSARLEAEATQAETYIRTIDALGIPRDHYRVARLVLLAEGNIGRWEKYTKGAPIHDPVVVPYGERFASKNCPMPECDYVGAPGSCPTHGQT